MNTKCDIKIKLIKMMGDEIETEIQLRKGYIKKIEFKRIKTIFDIKIK